MGARFCSGAVGVGLVWFSLVCAADFSLRSLALLFFVLFFLFLFLASSSVGCDGQEENIEIEKDGFDLSTVLGRA